MIRYKNKDIEIEFDNVEQLNSFIDRKNQEEVHDADISSAFMFIQNISNRIDSKTNILFEIGSYLIVNAGNKSKLRQFYKDFDWHHKDFKDLINKRLSFGEKIAGTELLK